jgi:phosphoribosylformylglycinamidine synthase
MASEEADECVDWLEYLKDGRIRDDSTLIEEARELAKILATAVRTAKKYIFQGRLSDKELDTIVNKVLANKLIQHVVRYPIKEQKPQDPRGVARFDVILIDIIKASDRKLLEFSAKGQLFLSLAEMRTIKKYFRNLGRNPTDCELETIAQTWSEHCHHKTFRGKIRYRYKENGRTKTLLIDNLLKKTIIAATEKIKSPLCVSVFHDNAGVIKFNDDYHVCFKVETHNHPSALEPFGGANTGVGGVIRDILGTGLGAKPICNTDVFCFAPPDFSVNRLPAGTLHPKRIMKGVVSGP